MTRGHTAPEVEVAYTRARELCQQLGDSADVFPVLFGLWRFYVAQPDLPLTQELGEELLTLAQRTGEMPLNVVAHCALGFTSLCLGELIPARHHLETGAAHYDHLQQQTSMFRAGQDPGVGCLGYAASTLWLLGYPDQARTHAQNAMALATALNHPFSEAYALNFAAVMWQFRRDAQNAYEYAETAITLSTEQGFALWLALGTLLRGWALTAQGQLQEGVRQMHQGLTDWRASGANTLVPYFLAVLAEGYATINQIDTSLALLDEASNLIEKTQERWWEAEMMRLQGVLCLMQSIHNATEAEVWFRQALEIAQRQQAKSLELRAAMSLGRLGWEQGKPEEGRALLAGLYNWFVEGFDTADLKDAKALLETLGR
jgi:predicted ATPase